MTDNDQRALTGLSESYAQARLRSEGFNELPRPDQRTFSRIIVDVLREPMLALLISGGSVYLLLGDVKEALILIGFALLSVGITVLQETRTEHVLEALRDLTSPRALVIRDGERRRIAGPPASRPPSFGASRAGRRPRSAVLHRRVTAKAKSRPNFCR